MALPISNDLRESILRFYENHDDYTQRELAEEFGLSKAFIEKLLQRWRATGTGAALPHGGGRKPLLKDHAATVQQLVAAQPDVTLAELQVQVQRQTQISVSTPTLTRVLQRLRLRRKKSPSNRASNKRPPSRKSGVPFGNVRSSGSSST